MYFLEDLEKTSDPRVKNWFMMNSIWPPLITTVLYLYIVKKLGPDIMKNYQPFDLKAVMIVFNVFQVLVNGYIVAQAFRLVWIPTQFKSFCAMVDYSDNTAYQINITRTVWVFHMTKLYDLLDTIFFILRKKNKQASFLHVFHHCLIYLFSWLSVKYFAGGHVVFFGTINSSIHIVMYTYYLLTAVGYEKNNIWWKKYLTQLQMIQFLVNGIHCLCGLLAENCTFSKSIILMGFIFDVYMFLLFWNFYKKTYLQTNDVIKRNDTSPDEIKRK